MSHETDSKLGLDPAAVASCRVAADAIATDIDGFVRRHTTVAVERTVTRLLGVDGVDADAVPLPNVLVDRLQAAGRLGEGVARPLVAAVAATGREPREVAEAVSAGELDLLAVPEPGEAELRQLGARLAQQAVDRVAANRAERARLQAEMQTHPDPLLYVIVATGNIYEDAVQGVTAAEEGADVIAVIRSTGQSLLDYVPFGATTEGFGGTYATQENFRIMRRALDEASARNGRYAMLCNYCSGLCMPEIAAMGALERLDMMLNDALYGILFRDINPQRTLVDQYFSRMINAWAGVIINTGEDNYLTTDDAIEATHTVLASQFINEALAARCGLVPAQMGLGHAMEMDPMAKDGFLMELAQAQLVRECFPEHRLKYMPPTKYMTGDIFRGLIQDALFNLVGVWTRQGIQLLGMHTEAMHTPHMADRAIAIESAKYVMNNARSLADEVEFKPGGLIRRRAASTVAATVELLTEVRDLGLFEALAQGRFAAVKRSPTGGRGLDGVAERAPDYYNPIEDALRASLRLEA
ncbi:MAG: lysine 5,6-aminomutase subunit alpha [Myxococcales bacterium]|nr:lysine 5,6-aminomutase subunit alpha [Myxococcales bacterium]MCB9534281.1 lysine 5,6-aminomutase subunit alpha [Myxococcales bacterium]